MKALVLSVCVLILVVGIVGIATIRNNQLGQPEKYDLYAKGWNDAQAKRACVAAEDMPLLGAHKGDHVVCDDSVNGQDSQRRPEIIPSGYRLVFYTSGCPTCAVGWVLKKGEECGKRDLNCAD